MQTQLRDSSVLELFVQNGQSHYYEFCTEDVKRLIEVVFKAIPNYLKFVKNKDQKVALRINDKKSNFVIAAIVDYAKSENPEMPGSWEFYFTTSEADLEGAKVILSSSIDFTEIVRVQAVSDYNMGLDDGSIPIIVQLVATSIITWLDQNAKDGGEKVELIHDNFFIASVVVEAGEKIMSIAPDGLLVNKIKDDAGSEAEVSA